MHIFLHANFMDFRWRRVARAEFVAAFVRFCLANVKTIWHNKWCIFSRCAFEMAANHFVVVVCARCVITCRKNTRKYCRILSERTDVRWKCETKQTVCVSVSRFVGVPHRAFARANETNRYKWPDCNRSLFRCCRFRCDWIYDDA